MRIPILLLFLATYQLSVGQSLEQLERKIAHTMITDVKKTESIAKRIFKIDPLNEIAVRYLTSSYEYLKDTSILDSFFLKLIELAPDSPTPYLLRAKYQYDVYSLGDSLALVPLSKAYALDSNNYETSFLLCYYNYTLFYYAQKEQHPHYSKHYARQSKHFLLRAIHIFPETNCYLKYLHKQLAIYLNEPPVNTDSACILRLDSNNLPDSSHLYSFYTELYFPPEKFLTLPDKWEQKSSYFLFHDIYLAAFSLYNYSQCLHRMNEPVLSREKNRELFRLTWLRSFHKPVVISIYKVSDRYFLNWKVTDGMGGYDPGKLIINETREVELTTWQALMAIVESTGYWQMPTVEDLGEVLISDGAHWIIEGLRKNEYHVIDRHSPGKRDKNTTTLGKFFIELTDLDIPKGDIY